MKKTNAAKQVGGRGQVHTYSACLLSFLYIYAKLYIYICSIDLPMVYVCMHKINERYAHSKRMVKLMCMWHAFHWSIYIIRIKGRKQNIHTWLNRYTLDKI
jgi:hypothetical protein